MKKEINSIQKWLPFEEILEKGVIKLTNEEYIKIINVSPINYNLKSELEKEGILNSYKTFLKTCNFDIQILIQSNKEDLSKHISKIQEQMQQEDETTKEISENYIHYIQEKNQQKKSTSKKFFILIKNSHKNNKESIMEELNEKYLKIKEGISKCGNTVIELEEKEECKKILYSFLNSKIYLENKEEKI